MSEIIKINVPNMVNGLELLEIVGDEVRGNATSSYRNKSYIVNIDDIISSRLYYSKIQPKDENDTVYNIPIAIDNTNKQKMIILKYPLSTKLRNIIADVMLLGGKFGDMQVNTIADPKPYQESNYSVYIYLNSLYNKLSI